MTTPTGSAPAPPPPDADDREVSADALPFADAALGALVLFDVLHHLPDPRRFFQEASRALRPAGRIVLCEPYVSLLSYPVYKFLHDEPLRRRIGEAARRRMCEHFSWDDLVGEVEAAYGHRPPATTLVR